LEKIKNIQFLQSNTGSGTFTVDNIKLIGLPSGGTPTPTPFAVCDSNTDSNTNGNTDSDS
jgi:hypothetical protein